MDLEQIRQKYSAFGSLGINAKQIDGNTLYITFLPKTAEDIDLAITQAKSLGFDLLNAGQIGSFNVGVNTVKISSTSINCEIYLVPNKTYTGETNTVKVSEQLSHYFYSEAPHLEQFLLEHYFPTKGGGLFLDTQAFDGVTNCPTKFFEESYGWSGISLEKEYFDLLYMNRTHTGSINVFGELVGPEEADGETKITYKMLSDMYNIEKPINWLHIRERGKKVLEIVKGFKGVTAYPVIFTFDFLDSEFPLKKLNIELEKEGYIKDSIFFNYAVYKRQGI